MPDITRAEARGILQQLTKLWQGRLSDAIEQLHAALLADVTLEAEVVALRAERETLTAAIAAARSESQAAADEVRTVQAALRALAARQGGAERALAVVTEQADQARRDLEHDRAKAQREHAAAQAAWQEAAGKERASRLAAIEREVAVHRERLDGEIAGLEARKAALEGALADVFSRYGASR